jgi:transcriptional regulator with XRE-family HTH domain
MTQKKEVTAMTVKERYRYIRSLMVLNNVTNAEIAEEAKVSREYVYYVMSGQRTGYRLRRVIAEKCGVQVEAIFPDTPEQQRRAA